MTLLQETTANYLKEGFTLQRKDVRSARLNKGNTYIVIMYYLGKVEETVINL